MNFSILISNAFELLKSYWKRGLFVVCWIFIGSELILKFFAPIPMLPRYIMAMDYGIRGNMPSETYLHRSADYKVTITTNAQGYRANREYPLEKEDGVKRVVLLGDSFAMGYGTDLEDTIAEQFVREMRSVGTEIEVINMGVSGFGNAEQLIKLREEALAFSPDLILLAWHWTDYDDNSRSGLFALGENGELKREAEEFLPAVKIREKLFSYRLYRWLNASNNVFNLARDRAGKIVQFGMHLMRSETEPVFPNRADSASNTNTNTEAEGLDPSRDVLSQQLALKLLREMAIEAKGIGAEFLIFEIPENHDRTTFTSEFIDPVPDDLHFVYPGTAFEKYPGKVIYWERAHKHLTPLGTKLVAEELKKYVREHSLF